MTSRCERCGIEFAGAGRCPACPTLPSFAAARLAGLTTVPVARARVAAPRERAPYGPYLAIAVLATLLLVMSGWVALHPRRTVVTTPDERGDAAAMSIDDPKIEIEAPVRRAVERAIDVRAPETAAERTNSATRVERRLARTTPRTRLDAPGETAATAAAPVPVACVLEPRAPACRPSTPAEPPAVAHDDADLPATLDVLASRAAITKVKAAAKACGARHGARAGEKVMVKLSILGATGSVASATPEGAHVGTALGRCVAEALAAATFPRFRKQVVGMSFGVTM